MVGERRRPKPAFLSKKQHHEEEKWSISAPSNHKRFEPQTLCWHERILVQGVRFSVHTVSLGRAPYRKARVLFVSLGTNVSCGLVVTVSSM